MDRRWNKIAVFHDFWAMIVMRRSISCTSSTAMSHDIPCSCRQLYGNGTEHCVCWLSWPIYLSCVIIIIIIIVMLKVKGKAEVVTPRR